MPAWRSERRRIIFKSVHSACEAREEACTECLNVKMARSPTHPGPARPEGTECLTHHPGQHRPQPILSQSQRNKAKEEEEEE